MHDWPPHQEFRTESLGTQSLRWRLPLCVCVFSRQVFRPFDTFLYCFYYLSLLIFISIFFIFILFYCSGIHQKDRNYNPSTPTCIGKLWNTSLYCKGIHQKDKLQQPYERRRVQFFSSRGQQPLPTCIPTPAFSSIKLCPNLLMIALLKKFNLIAVSLLAQERWDLFSVLLFLLHDLPLASSFRNPYNDDVSPAEQRVAYAVHILLSKPIDCGEGFWNFHNQVRLLLLYFIPDVASALAFGLGHVQKNTIPFDKLWPVRYITCLQLFSNGGLADWLEMFSLNHAHFVISIDQSAACWHSESLRSLNHSPDPEPSLTNLWTFHRETTTTMESGEIKMRFGRCPYCRTMIYQNPEAVIFFCSKCRTPIRGATYCNLIPENIEFF